MRTLLISTILATSGIAAAQPGPPANCAVTIVRAPDAVRETIEQQLSREHCTVALQVRIIPTEGGLYLLATDEHGRVRERIVPDASSAGVLIASWAADDGLGGTSPGFPPPAPISGGPNGGMAAPPPLYSNYAQPSAYGPGAELHPPGAYEPIDGAVQTAAPAYPTTYLSLAAGLGTNASGTLRAELDFYSKSGWSIGGLISATSSSMDVYDYTGYGSDYTTDISDYVFAITAGHASRWGDWFGRGGIALGVVESTMDLVQYDYNTGGYDSGSGSVASPYVEANLRVGRSFGATNQWALEGGLVLSYTKQSWYLADSMNTLYREAGNLEFIVGVRRGL